MSQLRFPAEGTYAFVDGVWREAVGSPRGTDSEVRLRVRDRRTFDSWRPRGERTREWKRDLGIIVVDLDCVDEVVAVRWHAQHDGVAVFMLGPVIDGHIYISPEHNNPALAHEQGFTGDGRIETLNKQVRADELRDLTEEITVVYRRGVPPL